MDYECDELDDQYGFFYGKELKYVYKYLILFKLFVNTDNFDNIYEQVYYDFAFSKIKY